MILEDSRYKKNPNQQTFKYHQHNIAAGSFKAVSTLHFI